MSRTALETILEITGATLEDLQRAAQEAPGPSRAKAVPDTPELQRILALPRRPEAEDPALAKAMSDAFKTPWGTMTLRPIQARALGDLHQCRGLLAPIRVGGGKTLLSYLAATILDAKRPMLVIPAKLKDKTRREFRALAYHWQGPHPGSFRIESYELLGRPQTGIKHDKAGKVLDPGLLARYQPDLIILDEAQKVKNHSAAVTRRIRRYVQEHPECRIVAMSGTIMSRSLREFAHVARWALPKWCPVPTTHNDLEAWAEALDERVHDFRRVEPGALRLFCNDQERKDLDLGGEPELSAVRRAFRRRLTETPGVVATAEGMLGTSLTISGIEPETRDPEIEAQFEILRTRWETPDGHPIADALTMARHAREIALGFYYRWNPRPPQEWLLARSAWASWCRECLKVNRRGLDSEAQIVNAVDLGIYRDGGLLREWRQVKDTFVPNTEAVWFSTEALDLAAKWARENAGIVWVSHVEFGVRLAEATGLPYYGRQGQDEKTGRKIEDADKGLACVASVASNAEGRNLQAWSKNLIMSPPPNGAIWEQLLGRTHRPGQLADEVTAEVFLGCLEHAVGFEQAQRDARAVQDATGQEQKILYADVDYPASDWGRVGHRWNKG